VGSQNYVVCTKAGSGKVSGGWLVALQLEVVDDVEFRERVGEEK